MHSVLPFPLQRYRFGVLQVLRAGMTANLCPSFFLVVHRHYYMEPIGLVQVPITKLFKAKSIFLTTYISMKI